MPPPMRLPPVCRSQAKWAAPQATARSSDGLVSTSGCHGCARTDEPLPHHLDQPLAQRGRREDAAVEQDRGGERSLARGMP